MARYRTTIPSRFPAHEVYAYLADFSNIVEWDPSVTDATLCSGHRGKAGSTYLIQLELLVQNFPLIYRIEDALPPSDAGAGQIVVQAENADIISRDIITITPTPDGGCTVEYDADLIPKSWRKLFDPAFHFLIQILGFRARGTLESAVNSLR